MHFGEVGNIGLKRFEVGRRREKKHVRMATQSDECYREGRGVLSQQGSELIVSSRKRSYK